MLIEHIVTESGRAGLKIKAEKFEKTLLRRRVLLSERKVFFEGLAALEKQVNEAQQSGNEEQALETSIGMIIHMLEGITREDFDENLDMYDIRELAEAMAELMQNGGKAAKKNA